MKNFQKIAAVFMAVSNLYFSGVAESQERMEPIVVTAQRWISDGNSSAGGSGSGSEGGFSAVAAEPNAQREQDRKQICTALNNSMQRNQCGNKATSAPTSQYALDINPQRFPTALFWGPAIFNAVRNSFNDGVQDFGALSGATAGAAVDACRGVAICIREVFVYFGINYVALPDGGISGNVNDIINEYMRAYLGPDRAPNPYFDTLLNKYANGGACVAAAQAATTMKC